MTAATELDPQALRRERKAVIRRASAKVLRAEAAYEQAVAERDEALILFHGDKRDGGLSYDEMATATGRTEEERISKGRVIQIVQGKSEYSKRQRPVAVVPGQG